MTFGSLKVVAMPDTEPKNGADAGRHGPPKSSTPRWRSSPGKALRQRKGPAEEFEGCRALFRDLHLFFASGACRRRRAKGFCRRGFVFLLSPFYRQPYGRSSILIAMRTS